MIRDTPTGPCVNIDSPAVPAPATSTPSAESSTTEESEDDDASPEFPAKQVIPSLPAAIAPPNPSATRVCITHGRQRAIAEQLKEFLAFGQVEPVVSVERETPAIPVPENVFEDMRSCSAGVIHVTSEGECLDKAGK